jgi:flagellar motor switch protein FliN/FliY
MKGVIKINGLLSQEEINALLKETAEAEPPFTTAPNTDKPLESLEAMEKDVLGELANISMGSAATALSALLGKKTNITTPKISVTTADALKEEYPQAYLTVNVNFTNGLVGLNVLVLHTTDAGVLVDLMMKGDGSNPPEEINELHISAISEAMDQMMNASTSALMQILNKPIEISPPVVNVQNFGKDKFFESGDYNDLVKISFALTIEGLVDSEMLQIIPISFAKQMVSELCNPTDVNAEQLEANNETDINHYAATNSETESNVMENSATLQNTVQNKHKQVEVTPVQFPAFAEKSASREEMSPNLDLIMDISLQLSVELGRTTKKIKEVLKLTNGSIVELDKLAGEPVDILVNGRLLAKGEVIIIDENFGVRVTEILSPSERIKSLK